MQLMAENRLSLIVSYASSWVNELVSYHKNPTHFQFEIIVALRGGRCVTSNILQCFHEIQTLKRFCLNAHAICKF